MNKVVYISTSIPYVNSTPHIGYSLEVVQTDALVRFYRLLGCETYFSTGTDENAIKNVEAAEKLGLSTKELVDKNSTAFFNLKETLNLSFNTFIRTTSEKHIKGAQKFWRLCQKDIYIKKYQGLYCIGCETFYKDNEFKDNICPLHNRKLEYITEENYFFALSKYQKQLEELIKNDTVKIYPEFRKTEVLNFIKKGLEDFSISRPEERTKGWGIPVPDDETQRMYVWFDALTNYITCLDFNNDGELFHKFWLENENRFLVIGKDIIKFHAIYWIAMLLSANLPLHKKIYVHGFITVDGKKMSKSLGNVVDPFELVKKYGTDAVRYYLLKEIPSLDDGDFSYSRMKEVYNSDLANELGNLVSRITTLCEKNNIIYDEKKNPTIPANIVQGGYREHIERFEFNLALEEIWRDVKVLNENINRDKPWDNNEKSVGFIKSYLRDIRNIAYALQPFLPETANKIINATGGKIKKILPLFPRLD